MNNRNYYSWTVIPRIRHKHAPLSIIFHDQNNSFVLLLLLLFFRRYPRNICIEIVLNIYYITIENISIFLDFFSFCISRRIRFKMNFVSLFDNWTWSVLKRGVTFVASFLSSSFVSSLTRHWPTPTSPQAARAGHRQTLSHQFFLAYYHAFRKQKVG